MASVLARHAVPARCVEVTPDIVIVGAGPVGIKTAQELHRRQPNARVVIYGDEASEPYNRVRLSGFLSGEIKWQALTRDLALPHSPNVQTRLGCAIASIDRTNRIVCDALGYAQQYSTLVLATGSRPHVPRISGIDLAGVYTFRNARDAEQLIARRVRSRRTVVLGGGLLGLEAARAMQRFNTEVCVVEHGGRLMMRQLDEGGAQHLLGHVCSLGIDVVLNDSLTAVLGSARVSGIRLRSGRTIECDTLIVATGIRPNIELARAAGLHVNRGIRVNDRMQTSDPSIYAVGECAEHRSRLYGLVAPGLEQAAVAAHVIAGTDAAYAGSAAATRLKVVSLPTFSVGAVTEEETPDLARIRVHRGKDTYRKLVTLRGRLIGALAVGECPEISRLQEAVVHNRRLMAWQAWRFMREGRLWPEEELTSVTQWPAATTVCNCTGVTRGALGEAIAHGCSTIEALAARTSASTVCGSCRPLLGELLQGGAKPEPSRGYGTLGAGALVTFVLAALLLAVPSIPYPDSAELAWRWDTLWRENFWKQVSGYTILSLAALGLLMSLRKRSALMQHIGAFTSWRIAHVLLGLAALVGLLVHTGGRLGSELNFLLSLSFLSLALLGAVAGSVISLDHRMSASKAQRLRVKYAWFHVALGWPLPVLLGFHVLKTYYF